MSNNSLMPVIDFRLVAYRESEFNVSREYIVHLYKCQGYPYIKLNDYGSDERRGFITWCRENIENGWWDYIDKTIFFTTPEDELVFRLTFM